MIDLPDYLLIAGLAFLIAGVIKGTVGIGLPTAAIGILGQFVDPRLAITLTLMPVFAANLWQAISAGQILLTVRKYWLLATTLVVFLGVFSQFVTALPTDVLIILIGGTVVVFSAINLLAKLPQMPEKYDRPAQLLTGMVSGILGGLTGLWGSTILIYFLSRRTEKQEFVRAVGALLFVGGFPLTFGYWRAGLFNQETATASVLLIVPTLIGFGLGEQIRKRLDSNRFRKLVLVIFLLMGLNLLRRGIWG